MFYIIQGNDATPDSLLNDAAERIITLTVKYCGGSGRIIKPEVT
ncbi:MAG TPA: RNA-binding protein [Ruminococcaceae bacterium]|nr:RNA-binding protein [Oscillospiraceae bacterium]